MDEFSARGYFAKLKIGDLFFKRLVNAVRAGENTVMQNIVAESMVFDDKWIKEIESLIYSVENIVRDPKKSIIDEAVVVQIEKAKKISVLSIRHLASHSNFVRAVDDDGTVHPSKIMTTIMDEDLLIYENRFVFTLIQRLLSFLEQRHTYLSDFSEKIETLRMNFKSDFTYNNITVEYDLKMNVKKPLKEKTKQDVSVITEKLEMLKKRVRILTGSDFYKKLSKTSPLTPPISKTNIIKMNVNYNNAYKLWLYISSFVNTGYSVKVSDLKLPVEEDYYGDLVYLAVIGLKTMIENNVLKDMTDNDYEDQSEREYYLDRNIEYIPDFNGFDLKETGETDYLNAYYYEKIKGILKKQEEENEGELKKDIIFSFTGFFKQLSNINNTLFNELLYFDYDKNNFIQIDKEQRKTEELKYYKEIFRRNNLLTKLKNIDLTNTMRKDAYILAKIKKLEQEINGGNEKNKPVKSVSKKGKSRIQIIESIEKKDEKLKRNVLKEAEKDIKKETP